MGYVPKDTLTYFLHFSAICHLPSLTYLHAVLTAHETHSSTQPPRTALTHDFQARWVTIRLIVAIVDMMSAEPSMAHDSSRSSSTARVALSDSHHARHSLTTHDFQGEYDQVDCCLLQLLIWALSLKVDCCDLWALSLRRLTTARVAHRQLA